MMGRRGEGKVEGRERRKERMNGKKGKLDRGGRREEGANAGVGTGESAREGR